jgi:putative tryptophan/tyrosine transport system substrate-binding protein
MATELKGRRHALAALAAGAVALHSGQSAFARAPRRIAVLHWNSRNGNTAAVRKEFPEAMAELGHIEGRNVLYEVRFSDRDFAKIEALAGEIVRSRPDAIIAHLSLTTRALAQSTSTIPIVAYIADPVMEGYSRDGVMPSRNVTGVADFWGERVTKLLEALKAIIPGFSRIAVVASKRDAQILDFLALSERNSHAMGIEQDNIMVSSSEEIERAFASMPGKGIRAAMTMDVWHLMPASKQAELALQSTSGPRRR